MRLSIFACGCSQEPAQCLNHRQCGPQIEPDIRVRSARAQTQFRHPGEKRISLPPDQVPSVLALKSADGARRCCAGGSVHVDHRLDAAQGGARSADFGVANFLGLRHYAAFWLADCETATILPARDNGAPAVSRIQTIEVIGTAVRMTLTPPAT